MTDVPQFATAEALRNAYKSIPNPDWTGLGG